jgi:hypothetical protein
LKVLWIIERGGRVYKGIIEGSAKRKSRQDVDPAGFYLIPTNTTEP